MIRGTCTICDKKHTIIRKVYVGSYLEEDACVGCSEKIIKLIKLLKGKLKVVIRE